MSQHECRHRIRFSLSDSSGELTFTDFEVINSADCPAAQAVQDHLVGRALSKVDWNLIETLGEQGTCTCANDVIAVLEDFQKQFSRRSVRNPESTEVHA